MQKAKSRWDIEGAAAWLRSHAWGADDAAEPAPAPAALDDGAGGEAVAEAVAEPSELVEDDIDIAGWPALVAPFYD